jgi:hypothetical protein
MTEHQLTTLGDIIPRVRAKYLNRYPHFGKYIDMRILKLNRNYEILQDRKRFIESSFKRKFGESDRFVSEEDYNKILNEIMYIGDYLSILKQEYIRNVLLFMDKLTIDLDKKENLKDYE